MPAPGCRGLGGIAPFPGSPEPSGLPLYCTQKATSLSPNKGWDHGWVSGPRQAQVSQA